MMGIQHRYPSLDDIATRSERPQVIPRTPTRLRTYSSPNVSSNSNSTHPHLQQIPSYGGCVPTSWSESGGGNERPLWENMPSSPLGPSSPERRRDRDLLDFGMGRRGVGGRRIWTLEWACAKARVKGARDEEDEGEDDDDDEEDEDEDQEEADRTIRRSRHHHTSNLTPNPLINQLGVLILPNSNSNPNLEDEEMDLDTTGGDTEDDEVDPPHEALTPSNSISLCGTHSTKKPRTSSRSISSQSIGFGESSSQEDYATVRARGRGKNVSGKGNVHDEEMMDAALALCGLGRRGSS